MLWIVAHEREQAEIRGRFGVIRFDGGDFGKSRLSVRQFPGLKQADRFVQWRRRKGGTGVGFFLGGEKSAGGSEENEAGQNTWQMHERGRR